MGKRVKKIFVLSTYVDKNEWVSIWHARLDHLSINKLKGMVSKNMVNGLPKLTTFGNGEVCKGCQYGKAHHLLFDKSFSKCKTSLKLIYSDLMLACVTSSYLGFCYMLLFVDDFTKYT